MSSSRSTSGIFFTVGFSRRQPSRMTMDSLRRAVRSASGSAGHTMRSAAFPASTEPVTSAMPASSAFSSVAPVSYTHLDVYKRQSERTANRRSFRKNRINGLT